MWALELAAWILGTIATLALTMFLAVGLLTWLDSVETDPLQWSIELACRFWERVFHIVE